MTEKRRLDAAEQFQPLAIVDLQGVLAGYIILAAALDDFDAAIAPPVFQRPVQLDHGIGKKTGRFQTQLRIRDDSRLVRQHGGQVFTVQAFDDLLQQFAVRTSAEQWHQTAVSGSVAQQSNAVDKDAFGAHFERGLEQQAIGRPHLLIQHFGTGKDDLQLLLLLQFMKVPAEGGCVADEFVRAGFKHHNDAGLVKLGDSPIDELHAEQSLAAARRTLHQDHIGSGNTAHQDGIEAGDTGLD